MESIIAMIAISLIKLTAMIAGYKIVALGHDTLVRVSKVSFFYRPSCERSRSCTKERIARSIIRSFGVHSNRLVCVCRKANPLG